jgi:hypothetical protein
VPRLSADQFSENWSKDYTTGYQRGHVDVSIPDALPHEPTAVRASAQQINGSSWRVSVTHGPHHEKDESGSYYKEVHSQMEQGVTMAKLKPTLKRLARDSATGLLNQRGQ